MPTSSRRSERRGASSSSHRSSRSSSGGGGGGSGGGGGGGGSSFRNIASCCLVLALPYIFMFAPIAMHHQTSSEEAASLPGMPSLPAVPGSAPPLGGGGQTAQDLNGRIAVLKGRQDMIDSMLAQMKGSAGAAAALVGAEASHWSASKSHAAQQQAPEQSQQQQQRQLNQQALPPPLPPRLGYSFAEMVQRRMHPPTDAAKPPSTPKKRKLGDGFPTHEEPKEPLPCSLNSSIVVDRALAAQSGVYYYEHSVKRCGLSEVSHKMEPGCPGDGNSKKYPEKQRQLLLVGVQRSGTHYAWEMYNRLGVHVHHEGLGPDGAVSWFFAYKTTGYAINNPVPLRDHSFCFVFHQVRHPMRVVSSIVKASRKPWDSYWDWITRTDPTVCGSSNKCKNMPLLKRSARQWLVWNEHIETYADIRFRVEDTSPRTICRLAMFDEEVCGSYGQYHTTSSKEIQPIVEPQAPSDNHTGTSHLVATWEEIEDLDAELATAMKDMTRRYGYHLDAAMHPQSLSTATFRAGGVEGAQDEVTAANKRRAGKGKGATSKLRSGKAGTRTRSVIRAGGGAV